MGAKASSRVVPQEFIQALVPAFAETRAFSVSAPKRKPAEKEQNTIENRNIPYKIYLDEADMPQAWYNLRADMKNKPAPLLNPGTGYFDMTAYQAFNDGKMTDYIPSDAELAQSIATLPKVPGME